MTTKVSAVEGIGFPRMKMKWKFIFRPFIQDEKCPRHCKTFTKSIKGFFSSFSKLRTNTVSRKLAEWVPTGSLGPIINQKG